MRTPALVVALLIAGPALAQGIPLTIEARCADGKIVALRITPDEPIRAGMTITFPVPPTLCEPAEVPPASAPQPERPTRPSPALRSV